MHNGPGFRAYFVRSGSTVYVLQCGGNKASQKRDIKMAKQMARDLKASIQ
jgi:putative addiction module killer protein